MMPIVQQLAEKAHSSPRRIVLPEGDETLIIKAAAQILAGKIGSPLLIGQRAAVLAAAGKEQVSLDGISIIDPQVAATYGECLERYAAETGFPEGAARALMEDPLVFGALMVHFGYADGMVAGCARTTADVINASMLGIGLMDGITTPSSFFVMEISPDELSCT